MSAEISSRKLISTNIKIVFGDQTIAIPITIPTLHCIGAELQGKAMDIDSLSDEELRSRLQEFGQDVPPVTDTTRKLLRKRLQKFITASPVSGTKTPSSTKSLPTLPSTKKVSVPPGTGGRVARGSSATPT